VLVEHTSIKEELEKFEDQIKSVMRTSLILRIGTSYKPDTFDERQRITSLKSVQKILKRDTKKK